ncbi:MAG: DUF1294 domain-containing protein [Ramlibacter sp.]|nr:DUF1294 domain-containing protein [Cryobacterium sp.]
MRPTGSLTSWNDDRGFGFISPAQGGPAVFVHITAFPRGQVRPLLGETLTYDLDVTPEGKRRATNAKSTRMRQTRPARTAARSRSGSGATAYLAIPAFLAIYLTVGRYQPVPLWISGLYLVASVVCFIVYAVDKSAATAGRWRVSESTLLLLGLAGGWPGAIVAQQTLRHKTKKASFRSAFWGSVIVNVVAFVACFSPLLYGVLAG